MKMQKNLKIAAAAVAVLWLVFFINHVTAIDLRLYGLRPRHLEGLLGILLAPFLHVDVAHLIANSGAFFVLLTVSLWFSRRLAIKALLIIIVMGSGVIFGLIGFLMFLGGLVWLLGGSNTVHVGASGVIFGLIGFLMFLGAFRREWTALVISAAVLLLYGGALQTLLIYMPGTSWPGHIFGFISGALAAWWTRKERAM